MAAARLARWRLRPPLVAALVAAAPLTIAGCASGPAVQRPGPASSAELRPVAQPGSVAATDLAFARAARETGQWRAFRSFAAPGALLHGAGGPFLADPWLAAQPDPARPVQWAPRAVWSSCDGTLAVSVGRSETPEGIIGSYITVWQLQRDGSYRWIYDTGTPDVPQPPPRPQRSALEVGPDVIVVPGLDAIDGRTADCPAGGPARAASAARARPAPAPPPPPAPTGGSRSADGSLGWRWEHLGEGRWQVLVEWQRNGAWEQALAYAVPAGEGG